MPFRSVDGQAHEIDFRIIGEDLQFVEVDLDPSESVVAEAGAMMYMEEGIEMATTLDHISHGRTILGIGGAWFEREHRLYGWDFPPRAERYARRAEDARLPAGRVCVRMRVEEGRRSPRPACW